MSGTASALVAPGAIVAGKYRLDAVIGEGGMGAVWAATHTGLGQAVAIKFISKEFVTSPEALRRFDAEAKAAAQLRSRHVVQVFDNGTLEDGTPYIAMELLRGENVYARVHRAGPVPLNEAIEILWQCCKALGRAHAAGIIHRDIKPDNIFLAQTDEDGILVKVLDFGIAKFAANPNDHGSTRTGAVLGTPLYMSPEQARGLKSIDYRTDLYSLGLVAYTMLTGNLAFSSESFGDLLLQICTAPLPSLCANAPWLPAAMETWFQRACARDPLGRFVSAQEFSDALRAAGDGTVRASALPDSMVQQALGAPGNPAHAVSVGTASGMSRSGDRSAAVVVPKSRGALVAVGLLLLLGAIAVAAVLTFARKDRPPETVAAGAAIATASQAVAALPGSAAPIATLAEPGAAAATTAAVSAAATGSVAPFHPAGFPGSPPHAASGRVPTPPPAAPPSAPSHGPGAKPIDLGY
jgi:eukaryotic-like serine/threonine-protein kinase